MLSAPNNLSMDGLAGHRAPDLSQQIPKASQSWLKVSGLEFLLWVAV